MRQEQVTWIFGYARSGSSWLARMMTHPEGFAWWNEPQVGEMLGSFHYLRYPHRRGESFLLSEHHREPWEEAIRMLVMGGAESRFPRARHVVIKEPHGSIGAPLLSQALPEARMVLLLRDPRDMVASALDAQREGSWAKQKLRTKGLERPPGPADTNPDAFVRRRAQQLMDHVTRAQEAYRSHPGPRSLVRYEDLRAEPLETLRRIFSDLSLAADERSLAEAVETHAWERIDPERRGEGKIFRKATPGGWREDLTPDQARDVERITEPILSEHYADEAPGRWTPHRATSVPGDGATGSPARARARGLLQKRLKRRELRGGGG